MRHDYLLAWQIVVRPGEVMTLALPNHVAREPAYATFPTAEEGWTWIEAEAKALNVGVHRLNAP